MTHPEPVRLPGDSNLKTPCLQDVFQIRLIFGLTLECSLCSDRVSRDTLNTEVSLPLGGFRSIGAWSAWSLFVEGAATADWITCLNIPLTVLELREVSNASQSFFPICWVVIPTNTCDTNHLGCTCTIYSSIRASLQSLPITATLHPWTFCFRDYRVGR